MRSGEVLVGLLSSLKALYLYYSELLVHEHLEDRVLSTLRHAKVTVSNNNHVKKATCKRSRWH